MIKVSSPYFPYTLTAKFWYSKIISIIVVEKIKLTNVVMDSGLILFK